EAWLLGSSPPSATWAAQLGLPYAYADFISPQGADIARSYRERFQEGGRAPRARTLVAAWVVCADTPDEAYRLATSSRMTLRLLGRGMHIPVPPPDEAIRFLEAEGVDVH